MVGPDASAIDDWHINMVAGVNSTLNFATRAGGGNIGLVLKNDGTVGIGTQAPSAKLHVVSSTPTGLGDFPSGVTAVLDSSSNNYLLFRNTADNASYSGIAMQDNNMGGYVVFGNAGGGGNDQLYAAGWGGVQIQYGGPDSINPSARTTVATFNSSGLNVNNGNLTVAGSPVVTNSNYGAYIKKTTGYGLSVTYDVSRATKQDGISHYGSYYSTATTNSPYFYDYSLQVTEGSRGFELTANWIGGNNISVRTLRDCCSNWFGWSELAFVAGSDLRKKTNIDAITAERAKEIILSLNGVTYDLVNEDGTLGNPNIEEPDARDERPKEFGYIAQHTIDSVPEVVKFNERLDKPNDVGWANAYSIDYERLVPVITEAMKDLYAEIDKLKAEIERLKNGA
jgi:hypothetical protein